MVNWLCQKLVSDEAAYIVCSALILAAVCAWVALKFELRGIHRELDRALELIRKTPEDPKAFGSAFDAFNKPIGGLGEMGRIWREFTESLLLPSDNGRQRIENTRSPSEYFSLTSIVAGRLRLKFYSNVSNNLVGLGILGTFLGLAAGIQLAFGDLNANKDLSEGLKGLLGGAFLSFSKSAVAIFASIGYGLAEKKSVGGLEDQIHQFCRELDTRLVLVTPEQIAARQLKELADQTKQLTRFNTDLAVSIAGALDERLAGQISPAVAKILDAVGQLRTDRSESNERMLLGVVDQFKATMSGAAGNEINALAGTLKDLQSTLSSSLDAMRTSQASSSQTSSNVVLQMEATLQRSQKAMEQQLSTMLAALNTAAKESTSNVAGQLQEAGQALVNGVSTQSDTLQRSVGKLEAAVASWTNVAKETTGLVQRFNESAQALDTAGTKLQALTQSLDRSSRALQSAGEKMANATVGSTEAATALRSGLETMKVSLERCENIWGSYQQRFEGVDESLAKVFVQLDEGLSRYSDRVRQFLTEVDKHLGSATQNLASAVSPLADGLEDLPAEVKALGSHIEEFVRLVNRLPPAGNGA